MTDLRATLQAIDDKLSQRFIDLDPGGYWLVKVDPDQALLVLEHYSNDINEKGLAVDPDTGDVIACQGGNKRLPTRILSGPTAKDLCVQLFESPDPCPVTLLNHAAYLGRELVRAEWALIHGEPYIQD